MFRLFAHGSRHLRRAFAAPALALAAGCALQPGLPTPAPPRAVMEGEFCALDLSAGLHQAPGQVLITGYTRDGATAACLDGGPDTPARLVLVGEPAQCRSATGTARAQKYFANYVIQVPDADSVRLRPLGKGSTECLDDDKLLGGGMHEILAAPPPQVDPSRVPLAVVTAEAILARVQVPLPDDLVPLVLGTVDVECAMQPWHTDAYYGIRQSGSRVHADTLLVCDPTSPPGRAVICSVEITEGIKIGITGNEEANHIGSFAIPMPCGTGGGLTVLPPNPDWAIDQLWLVGMGGADRLRGIDAPDTANVIYGDYFCSPPLDASGAYSGAGGNDRITGGPGDDHLYGEEGNDRIEGGNGNDHIYGASTCVYYPPDDDHISGGAGNDRIFGDTFNSSLGGGDDELFGMAGNDLILGGPGDDEIWGESWDWASLPEGDDDICGEAGADRIHAGPGCDDVIIDADDPEVDLGTGCSHPGRDFSIIADCPFYPPGS